MLASFHFYFGAYNEETCPAFGTRLLCPALIYLCQRMNSGWVASHARKYQKPPTYTRTDKLLVIRFLPAIKTTLTFFIEWAKIGSERRFLKG